MTKVADTGEQPFNNGHIYSFMDHSREQLRKEDSKSRGSTRQKKKAAHLYPPRLGVRPARRPGGPRVRPLATLRRLLLRPARQDLCRLVFVRVQQGGPPVHAADGQRLRFSAGDRVLAAGPRREPTAAAPRRADRRGRRALVAGLRRGIGNGRASAAKDRFNMNKGKTKNASSPGDQPKNTIRLYTTIIQYNLYKIY